MRTIAKKLSAYNRHVRSFAKTYKGKNLMKAAAKAWKKKPGSTTKKTQKSSPKKTGGKKTVTKKGGFRLPGGLGPKGILTGALGLIFIPQLIPVQSPGAKMAATGLALRALKLGGGGALTSVGLITMAVELLSGRIGGVLGGLGGGGNGGGGTDY